MLSSSLNTKGAIPSLSKLLTNKPRMSVGPQPTTPGVLQSSTPKSNMSVAPTLGNNPGMIKTAQAQPSPKADTPLKKTTTNNVDGSSTTYEYHAPAENKTTSKRTPTPAPTISTEPSKQAQNVSNAGAQTQNEFDAQRKLRDAAAVTAWEDAIKSGEAVESANKRLSDFRVALAKEYGDIESQPIPLEFQQGRGQVLARQAASTESALQSGVTNALTNQGQQFAAAQAQAARTLTAEQGAYSGAQTQANRGLTAQQGIFDASLPGQQGTSSQLYNPLEGATGGNSVVSGANRQSAYDLTTQKNNLQSTFNGVEANYDLLINTARAGGVNDMNIPALNALQQNIQKGLTSNEAVINFRNTLAAVRAGYAQILGGGTTTVDSQNRAQEAIPENISLGALISLGEQLKSESMNRIAGIDQTIQSLTGGNNQPNGESNSTGYTDFNW